MPDEKPKPKLGFKLKKTKLVMYSIYCPEKKRWGPVFGAAWNDRRYWASPWSAAVNYARSVIEGVKAFGHEDGQVFIFRPNANAKRLNNSLFGMLMPRFPEEKFIEAVYDVVKENIEFVPKYREGALYIRPVVFGGDGLGIALDPDLSYTTAVWSTPVGEYLQSDISLWVEREITRAMPGGIGALKAAANYPLALITRERAKKQGCHDAVTLDGQYVKYLQELTGANIFIVKNNILFTPIIGDTILPGITRDSLITLARNVLGLKVFEKRLTVEELLNADEAYCCGTAASVTSISRVKDGDKFYTIGNGKQGRITKILHNLLTGIQFGDHEDVFGWLTLADRSRS